MRFLEWLILALLGAAISFVVALIGSQFVVWGLSAMGISSGIWGPYLILAGMAMVISTSITVNSSNRRR